MGVCVHNLMLLLTISSSCPPLLKFTTKLIITIAFSRVCALSGICYKNPVKENQKFGLLQNCEHAFCLPCIRTWRGSESADSFGKETVRACPVCRVNSYLIIPSDHFENDLDIKCAMVEQYRAKLRKIPCRYFAFGEGECPFGTSCMYSHVDREGNESDKNLTLKFSDTGSHVKAPATLQDFL